MLEAAHLQMVPSPHETPHREGVLFIPLKFGIPTQAALATSPFSPCLGSVLLRWRAHARGCRPHPTGPGPPRQAPSSSASHPAWIFSSSNVCSSAQQGYSSTWAASSPCFLGSETLSWAIHRYKFSPFPVHLPSCDRRCQTLSSAGCVWTSHSQLLFQEKDNPAWRYPLAFGLNCSGSWRERFVTCVLRKADAEKELQVRYIYYGIVPEKRWDGN